MYALQLTRGKFSVNHSNGLESTSCIAKSPSDIASLFNALEGPGPETYQSLTIKEWSDLKIVFLEAPGYGDIQRHVPGSTELVYLQMVCWSVLFPTQSLIRYSIIRTSRRGRL